MTLVRVLMKIPITTRKSMYTWKLVKQVLLQKQSFLKSCIWTLAVGITRRITQHYAVKYLRSLRQVFAKSTNFSTIIFTLHWFFLILLPLFHINMKRNTKVFLLLLTSQIIPTILKHDHFTKTIINIVLRDKCYCYLCSH